MPPGYSGGDVSGAARPREALYLCGDGAARIAAAAIGLGRGGWRRRAVLDETVPAVIG